MIWNRKTDNTEVRQYLLGNISQSAREKLERRVLNDADVSEEILVTEDELIDQYLGGKLNAEEQKRFESYFLIPQERQQKLRFGRTLLSYLESLPIKTKEDVKRSVTVRFGWLEPRPVLVTSVVILCLAVVVALFLVRYKSASTRVTGGTLAITLDPGSSRANGGKIERIAAPASYGSVEVALEIGNKDYQAYEVELLRERQSIRTYKSIQAQTRDGRLVLVVVIPAELLEPGDYVFKLSGATASGQPEYKDQYQLRVLPTN